ncbi:hypothetical protein [Pseudorhodoplanes sp.]|uniref:hypothetical protein n=1 Tax=Pseudorhodoplanes sp. TaxID=1934341 RepID=UPI003D11A976
MLTAPTGQPKVVTRESALPKCAQKRLAQLRALVDDYEAARTNLQKRLNGLMPDESMEREEVNKRIIANNRSLSYAKGLLNLADQWLVASGALAHYAPTALTAAPPPRVGEAQWGRIENIRTEVARIKAQMIEVKRAPLPFKMFEEQLKVTVNRWASEGEPRVEVDQVKGHVNARWGAAVPASYKIMAWLHRDAMLAKLIEQARKQADTRGTAMSPEAKAENLKALSERLQSLELEEVALIDAMQSQGVPDAVHRLDISPAALLGVKEPKGIMRSALVA